MPSLEETRLKVLEDFCQAWNDHDIEALMNHMTDDGIFDSSAGPLPVGNRFEGSEQLRQSYLAIFDIFPDAKWNDGNHFICGDRGISEWRFTGTKTDGTKVNLHGCDLFLFDGEKIKIKDSYRKNPA